MAKKDDKNKENYVDIQGRAQRLEALINLSNDIRDKERRIPIPFNDFLHEASTNPERVFRNIFQLFHDFVKFYVPEGRDEYETTDETIGFLDFNSHDLFVKDCDEPFFADRLFANRFMNMVDGFRKGRPSDRIYLFEGPPGSGKSTFLNNLLLRFENYTRIPEGIMYKTYWKIDLEKIGGLIDQEGSIIKEINEKNEENVKFQPILFKDRYLNVSCPNNDHPILQIPKSFREKFLDELIPEGDFKERLFNSKEYEWVLKEIPCSICSSIYNHLLDKLNDPLEVYNMLNARRMNFDRQFGVGISIYNPGDERKVKPITNPTLQAMINAAFKTDEIKFTYSDLANTNNGILALMDIKENNVDRLMSLHGIISDGVHKVDLVEERIRSMFVGIVNPEDKKHYENVKSFQDRIIKVNIPYVLDYETEVSIYSNKFGNKIDKYFLPGVLENFAKIIVSSRLDNTTPSIKKWINKPEKYSKYVDKDLFLLKMEVYRGIIPSWLTEEDLKKFDRNCRKAIIAESEIEGKKGISGRQSLNVFNTFLTRYSDPDKLITMDMLKDFFSNKQESMSENIAEGFMKSLEDMYNYNVLQEVKEAIYFYNEERITKDIINYLYAINYEPGDTVKCPETGDTLEISDDYFKNIEIVFLGPEAGDKARKTFRTDNHSEYISNTLAQEIRMKNKKISETEQFKNLFNKYTWSLKENALAPYTDNDNFKRAIEDFGTPGFRTYDNRVKRDVTQLINNLEKKFNYNETGARQVCLYVIEKQLMKKY